MSDVNVDAMSVERPAGAAAARAASNLSTLTSTRLTNRLATEAMRSKGRPCLARSSSAPSQASSTFS